MKDTGLEKAISENLEAMFWNVRVLDTNALKEAHFVYGKVLASFVIDKIEKNLNKAFKRKDVWHGGELDFVLFKKRFLSILKGRG